MNYRPYKLAHLQLKLISAKLSTEEALEAVAKPHVCARSVKKPSISREYSARNKLTLRVMEKKIIRPIYLVVLMCSYSR